MNVDNSDNESRKPQDEEIEEEVYLASEGQNALVQQVLPQEEDSELRPFSAKPNPEPEDMFRESKTKDVKTSSSPSDVNKVLLDNLKVLGLSKLSKDILKDAKSRKLFKKIMSKPTSKLPCPLEFMNGIQLSSWLLSRL